MLFQISYVYNIFFYISRVSYTFFWAVLCQLSSLQTKMVSYCEVHINVWDIEHQLQEEILHHYFRCIFIQFRKIFNPRKSIYRQFLWHCPTIQIIYIPIFKIWRFFVFTIIFHLFFINFCYLLMEWHNPSLVPSSTINNMSISVHNSN